MRIILDSNEYIFGLDTAVGPSPSSRLLELVRILIDDADDLRAGIGPYKVDVVIGIQTATYNSYFHESPQIRYSCGQGWDEKIYRIPLNAAYP